MLHQVVVGLVTLCEYHLLDVGTVETVETLRDVCSRYNDNRNAPRKKIQFWGMVSVLLVLVVGTTTAEEEIRRTTVLTNTTARAPSFLPVHLGDRIKIGMYRMRILLSSANLP
jgi:hypothetical protein